MLKDLVDDTLDDFGVGADELFAGHAGLAGNAAGDNHHLRTCRRRIVIGYTSYRRIKVQHVRRLHDVHCFAFGQTLFDVDEDDFTCKTFGREDVCHGRPDITCSNYSYLHLKLPP